ncbi:MAG: Cell division protein FtsL [Verrucomicrobia subdivision 3 bacterium]|nr:Cell division protein FtsL [Limisphaerales bacterium]MCS1412379.1 Cell division protein FtsL [Limisphaerales bacterium]
MWRREKSRDEVIGAGWFIKAAVVCFFVGGSCAGYLWQKNQVHELGQKIRGLERELDQLEQGNDVLRQRYAVLESQPELNRRVREFGLDLRPPAPEQIFRLREAGDGRQVSFSRSHSLSTDRDGDRN